MSVLAKFRLFNKKRKSSYRGEEELHILRFLCDSNKISIDVGANKGNYSLEMSKHSKKVLSFEPNISFNKYLNKMPLNCVTLNYAVTANGNSMFLHAPIVDNDPKNNMAFISDEEYEERSLLISKVQTVLLDDYASEEIGMIKIDVEGTEVSVLNGSKKIIEKYSPNFLIEGLTKQELREQIDFFKPYNYIALKIINGKIFFVHNEEIHDKCRETDRNTIFMPSPNLD